MDWKKRVTGALLAGVMLLSMLPAAMAVGTDTSGILDTGTQVLTEQEPQEPATGTENPVVTEPENPEPTEPEPTEPEPTEPEPTDPEPIDPEPTDPEPTEPEPTDPEPTEPEEP